MAFKEGIKVKWGHWGIPQSNVIGGLLEEEMRMRTHRGKSMWRERRQPSTSQGESCQQKTTLPTPWSLASGLQNYEEINFCCLIHLAFGIHYINPSKLIQISTYVLGENNSTHDRENSPFLGRWLEKNKKRLCYITWTIIKHLLSGTVPNFTCMISLDPYNLMHWTLLFSPFYRWDNRGLRESNGLSKSK